MMNALWIAKTGMTAQQTQLDVISHNLANTATTGFKRNRAEFQDLMYQNHRQVGSQNGEDNQLPTGLHLGLGVDVGSVTREFTAGSLQKTGNDFDLAIDGDGFFQVQLPDGATAYTRDGSFKINHEGQIVTASGYPLLGAVTKQEGAVKASVDDSGNVQFFDKTNALLGSGKLNLASFINPTGLQPTGNNLYRATEASGEAQTGDFASGGAFGAIKQGFLENSNVNVVTELVSMIATQRAYEMNSKAIQTTDQMLAKLSQL